MFNKGLNVSLVFLIIIKTKFLKSECYNDKKTVTKKLKLCSPQTLSSKKDLKQKIKMLWKSVPWKKQIATSIRGAAWICKWVSDKKFCVKLRSVKLKSISLIQNTLYFRNVIGMVHYRQKTFKKKISFRHGIWVVAN